MDLFTFTELATTLLDKSINQNVNVMFWELEISSTVTILLIIFYTIYFLSVSITINLGIFSMLETKLQINVLLYNSIYKLNARIYYIKR